MAPRILIADDDERIRELVRLYLEAEGYEIDEAENGNDALEKVRHGIFDLVILDLMMPGLDGWTVCKILRKETKVPIIMLTAKGEENDRVLGFDLGADDYVVKPFSTGQASDPIRRLSSLQSPVFLLNSCSHRFSATPSAFLRKGVQPIRAHLLPKLRCQFAEFLHPRSLKRLGIFFLPTCVGLGYGHHKTRA